MDSNNSTYSTTPIVSEAQTPIAQPSSSSNKTKYILLGLLALLIIVAVGGGSYYLGAVKQQPAIQENNNAVMATTTPSEASKSSLTPIPSSSSNTAQTPISTTNPPTSWKKYTNTKYNYSFSYPQDAVVSSNDSPANPCNMNECGYLKINTPGETQMLVEGNDFPSYVDTYKTRLAQLQSTGKLNVAGVDYTLETFQGYPAIVNFINLNGTTFKNMNIIKDKAVYSFYYNSNSSMENQLLSTFKFTK